MGEFTVTLSQDDLYRGFLLNAANRKARPLFIALFAVVALLFIIVLLEPSA